MSYDITQKVKVTNPASNVDWYYGGDNGYWNSIEEALLNVPREVRQIGKTIAILDNGSVAEYWWKSGIEDSDLVLKFGLNTKIINEYNDTFENLGGVTSVCIPESSHKMGLYPFVQCYLNGEMALFDVTNNNGDIIVSWNNVSAITNNDVITIRIVKSEQRFVYEQGEVNSFTIPKSIHGMGDYPFVQVWKDGDLAIVDIRNNNGDITISWGNDFTIDNELYVIFDSNVYTSVFTNEDDDNSLVIDKATHGKGNTPILQCYLNDELALLDVSIDNGNITISWADSGYVSTLNPLRVIVVEQMANEQAINYDVNDLVVIGEKNEGDGGITTTKNVGGVNSGVFIEKNTLLNEVLRNILSPTLNPTLVAPSATMSVNVQSKLFEVGSTSQVTFTIDFNRGSISPQYASESPYRSGVALDYKLNGGVSNGTNTIISDVYLKDENDNDIDGFVTYVGSVDFAEGVQPKNSNGDDFSSPLASGSVNTNEITFEFVYPIYASTIASNAMSKQALVSRNKGYVELDFAPQDETNRYSFELPSNWQVTYIFMYNTVAESYDESMNKIDNFESVTINKNGVSYKQYRCLGTDKVGRNKFKIGWKINN